MKKILLMTLLAGMLDASSLYASTTRIKLTPHQPTAQYFWSLRDASPYESITFGDVTNTTSFVSWFI